MEIHDVQSFIDYHSRIKQRTRRLLDYIPEDKLEWTYQAGKFTLGDIIRHVANIERHMYAETVRGKPSKYSGCGPEYAEGLANVIRYYDRMQQESQEIFLQLDEADLHKKCRTPGGIEITTWKWLRALVEHEVHHRGQLYLYLTLNRVKTPPLFGLTAEEVAAYSSERG
ncbi:MAG: DinB family protein [Leptolyngbya sp. SIO3F4]|nr:DinB family protein [Leptolyngbya sp. SIO3F4]